MAVSHPIKQLTLLDLIPLVELQQLQDTIAQINGVKSVITDPEGNLLTMPSNEIPLCPLASQIPAAHSECIENLKRLAKLVRDSGQVQQLSQSPCREFGVVKAAVPIIVNDIHLANWCISQYSPERTSEEQIRLNADKLGIDGDQLITLFADQPQHDAAHFEKTLTWVAQLVKRISVLGYQNLMLSRDVDKVHHLENELQRYKNSFEELIQDRTADLMETNQRMQLEVLERDLIEEQVERKSQLLDAINQMLQSTLTHQSDTDLADRCLHLAFRLTGSNFGFLVEYSDLEAKVLAKAHAGRRHKPGAAHQEEPFDLYGIWKEIIQSGEPMLRNEPLPERQQPEGFPLISALLAVPMHSHQTVTGFIALANKPSAYAPIDLNDIRALLQAFAGVLYRNRLEQTSHHSEKRLKLALDSANEGLWDYCPATNQIYFSPRWYTMLGYSMDEFPSTMETWHALTHPEDLPQLKETFNGLIAGENESFRIEIRMLSQAPQWHWIQVRGSTAERDADSGVTRIVGTLMDISKYKQVELALQKANTELKRLAELDDLTQIANRRRFDERLLQEWRRARRDHTPLALVIGDIDFFKSYNDHYGHLKGDDALHTVAQAIQAVLKRSMDLVARIGGEEFAIILPNTDIEGAISVAQDVIGAIELLKIEHERSEVNRWVTCSFGVASLIPAGNVTSKTLIDRSDKALYQAKANGRNQIMPYSEEAIQKALHQQ